MPGRFPIFQFPNPPADHGATARILARLVRGPLAPMGLVVSPVALLVWAAEEIAAGANWFRRLLGVGGGGYALSRLFGPVARKRTRASAQ
jgi:hypothetical protein